MGELAQTQDLGTTYQYGRSLYQDQAYTNAIKTFKRVLYFSEDTLEAECYWWLGQCFYQVERYEAARYYYERASRFATTDSFENEVRFQTIRSFLLQQNYRYAHNRLLSLPDTLSSHFQHQKNFYAGITHFGLGNYDTSRHYFLNLLPDTAQHTRKKINLLFEQNRKNNRLNPKTAQIMSLLLPGLGQVYAGDIKNGINSLLLTSSFLAIGINTAMNLTILDAIISVYPWYLRYYMGGYQKAGEIAKRKLQRQQKQIYNQLLETIRQSNTL